MDKRLIQKAGQTSQMYKYKIDYYRKKTTRDLEVDLTIKEVAEMLQIPLKTFNNDRSILINDSKDIPVVRLRKYARAFNVDILQLCNEPNDQKTIEELIESEATESQSEIDQTSSEFELD